MKEMSRTGLVQIVDGETVYQSLQDADSSGLYDETARLRVSAEQMARMHPVVERQIKTFLQALENEFRGREVAENAKTLHEYGVGVFSWKD